MRNSIHDTEETTMIADASITDKAELIVYNDDYNTFDWVIKCFMEVCNHTFEQSEQLSLLVHFKGKAVVKAGTFEKLKYFPHPLSADHDGLLAIGGDLSVERLLFAYRYGIFPWYNDPPVMWWWTHPRCVLYPSKVKVSKSMRPYFNQKKYSVTYNKAFEAVITACASLDRPET